MEEDFLSDYDELKEQTQTPFMDMLEIDIETISDEEQAKLPANYKEIISEIKDDEEYNYIKNMPAELISSVKEFNFKMYTQIRKFNKLNPVKPAYLATKELKEREILRCKYDLIYYCENYVILPTVSGDIKFLLNDKIRCSLRLFEAGMITMFMTSRQSSKTTKDLVGFQWYFNFWSRSKTTLVNTAVAENKKNLRFIMTIYERLPDFLNTFKEHPNKIDNVMEKVSGTKAEIGTGVVDASDPSASLRGKTSALGIDEAAYLKGIDDAYPAMAFIYSAYGKMAKKTFTPAPFSIVSTPNAINLANGAFFHNMWTNAYEVPYGEIKDLLPFEIYKYFSKRNIVITKVEQYWYEFPERATRIDVTDPAVIRKYHYKLMNIDTTAEEIYDIDPGLGAWLQETKATSRSLVNIKKDIYCMFLNGASESIFEEELLDELIKSKRFPIRQNKIPGLKVEGTLDFYQEIEIAETHFNYFGVFDLAYSLSGDFTTVTILDNRDFSLVATARFRTGRVTTIVKYIKFIVMECFFGEMAFSVERNSFGASVAENCEDDEDLKGRFYYEVYEPKYGNSRDFTKRIYGLTNTTTVRSLAITEFLSYVKERFREMKCSYLIDEITSLVDKNNKIQALPGSHDDVVMSLALTLYTLVHRMEIVRRISMTSSHKRNSYSKIIDLNSKKDTNKYHITKEERDSKVYAHYENQFNELKNEKISASKLFSRLNQI